MGLALGSTFGLLSWVLWYLFSAKKTDRAMYERREQAHDERLAGMQTLHRDERTEGREESARREERIVRVVENLTEAVRDLR